MTALNRILAEQREARELAAAGNEMAQLGASDWVKEEILLMDQLKDPFTYFGGKSRIASVVWDHFGDIDNYVEPFFGSGAVLLARPHPPRIETVNDKDAYLANFWRALAANPDAVAQHADWPVDEVDLEARHKWLVQRDRKREHAQRMKDDPDYYDVKMAGWWVWGIGQWIGRGWCSGEWVGAGSDENMGCGINVADPERGGKRPHLGAGRGIHRIALLNIQDYFRQLAARLRRVRVCCGDWKRLTGPTVTYKYGTTGVFLDPPYSAEADRTSEIYAEEDLAVAHEVREWAIEAGENPLMRIALCGYDGEHLMPDSWETYRWKAHGGYGTQSQEGRGRDNAHREVIWFSPHCLREPLFRNLPLDTGGEGG